MAGYGDQLYGEVVFLGDNESVITLRNINLHVSAIGIAIEIPVIDTDGGVINISNAIIKEMLFQKPDGSLVTEIVGFATDGADGILQYVCTNGFLDQSGTWRAQGRVTFNGALILTDIRKFKVLTNLPLEV